MLTGSGVHWCQVETECQQNELSMAEQKQVLRLKSRAVELLPDGAANLTKLQVGLGLDWQAWGAHSGKDLSVVVSPCLILPPSAPSREQCPAGHPLGRPMGEAPGSPP